MKLYHFCAGQFLEGIKKEGLTKGMIPVINGNKVSFLNNCQWLTINPSFNQSWQEQSSLEYHRNDYRITIKIPTDDRRLVKWDWMCQVPHLQESATIMNSYGDPENWYVYLGIVKTNWFREIIPNPNIVVPLS